MTYPGSRSHTWVAGERVDHDDLNEWASKNAGWGIVSAPVQKTSAQGSITTVADISGLTITFTADATRQYMAIAHVYVSVTGGSSNDVFTVTIANGSNTPQNTGQINAVALSTDAISTDVVAFFQGTGSVTIKVRGARKTGAGTWTVYGDSSGNVSNLTVIDIGPASP